MSQCTPVPWTFAIRSHAARITGTPNGRECNIACDLYDDDNEPDDMAEIDANGYLMAAAPNLLQGCRRALADLEGFAQESDYHTNHPVRITIRELQAAIAKATGEAVQS